MDKLTRNQSTIRFIASVLLELEVGDRLPPIMEINATLRVGVGTVQKALGFLRDIGAVMVSARGHMGSYVDSLDYALLWQQAGKGPLRLLLPFVDAPEFKGLSEGLDQALEQLGVRARIDHRRGASARLGAVLEGTHDVCVVSSLVFEQSLESTLLDGIVLEEIRYYRPGSVLVVSRRGAEKPLRVGYDPKSLDHYLLTKAEFDGAVPSRLVVCPYAHLLSAILASAVDCGIWHRVDIGVALGLLPIDVKEPQAPATAELLKRCERACFIFRRDRPDVRHLLSLVDRSIVAESQAAAEDDSNRHQNSLLALIR